MFCSMSLRLNMLKTFPLNIQSFKKLKPSNISTEGDFS